MKTTVHLFDIEDAQKYGIREAIILYNIRHWLDKNKANKNNIIEGRIWTYNSASAFSKLFPYMTESQIRRSIKKLLDDGVLLKGEHNKKNYDKTSWYTVDEDKYIMPSDEFDTSISRNRHIHLTESSNGTDEIVTPIPDINTNNKTNINTHTYSLREKTEWFIDLWNRKHGTTVKLTDKKQKQVSSRMKVFTSTEIINAINNRLKDDWFSGEGAKFLGDWDSFWRNDEKVERYLNRKDNSNNDLPF